MLLMDLKLDNKLELEKIGVTFRQINDNEVDIISNKYNADMEKVIDIANECYNSITKNKNKKKIEEKEFLSFIRRLFVIEISKDKLNKYIDEMTNYTFVRRIFNLYNELYIDKKISLRSRVDRTYKYVFINDCLDYYMRRPLFMRHNLIKNEITDYDVCALVVYYLLALNDTIPIDFYPSKYVDYLNNLSSFFSKSNTEDIEKMIDILEFWFTDAFNNKNKLVNNVLVLESLLMSSNSNIEKNFIAKCGLLVYRTKSSLSNNTSEQLSAILAFVYSIRSDVVHGNINNVYNDYNILKTKIGDIIETSPSKSRKRKRDEIYLLAYNYSSELVVTAIKFWFDNKNELDFIKDNVVL